MITKALMLRSFPGKATFRNFPAGRIPSEATDERGKEVSFVSRADIEVELTGEGLAALRPVEAQGSILAYGNLGLLSLLATDNDIKSSPSSGPVACELPEAID